MDPATGHVTRTPNSWNRQGSQRQINPFYKPTNEELEYLVRLKEWWRILRDDLKPQLDKGVQTTFSYGSPLGSTASTSSFQLGGKKGFKLIRDVQCYDTFDCVVQVHILPPKMPFYFLMIDS